MKAISNKEHQLLLNTIKGMEKMDNCKELFPILDREYQSLVAHFQQYRLLLTDLSVCITEYERIRHRLKVEVLGPAMRKARKRNIVSGR
jgi:hypothetical protein